MMISNVAGEFLAAAQSLHSANASPSRPLYFLICQSIEPSLKAYIRSCGAAREQLKKIGHDLEKALNRAQSEKLSQFFSVTPDQEQAIRMINPYYAGKDLQYTEGKRKGKIGSGLDIQHSASKGRAVLRCEFF